MWTFTRYGFYSTVQARDATGKYELPGVLSVRARLRSHLEALTERFPEFLPPAGAIIETWRADYRYRLLVDRYDWADVVSELAREIDYTNFKNECPDPDYHKWLNSVWGAGFRAQEAEQTVY